MPDREREREEGNGYSKRKSILPENSSGSKSLTVHIIFVVLDPSFKL